MRVLSFRQPWLDAILRGGKRIENRVGWKNCHYRGPILLHASVHKSKGYHREVRDWASVHTSGLWMPPALETELPRGGIVGRADIVGIVQGFGTPRGRAIIGDTERPLDDRELLWWMGGFALVLDRVQRLDFVPCAGSLGLFRVPVAAESAVRAQIGNW
jgi:hypothetical protein